MKNHTILLLVLIASIFSLQVSATDYIFTKSGGGSWSPSNPQSATLTSADSITIKSGTFKQSGSFTIPAGVGVAILKIGNKKAIWQVDKNDILTNYSTTFIIQGKLEVKGKPNGGVFNNYGNVKVESTGELKITEKGIFNNYGTISVDGKLKLDKDAAFNNDGTVIINQGGKLEMKSESTFTNDGTVVVNGTLDIKHKKAVFDNTNGTVVGTGTIKLKKDSNFNNTGGTVNGCTGSSCVTKANSPNDLGATSGAPNVSSFVIWNGTQFLTLEGTPVSTVDETMAIVLQANLVLTSGQNLVFGTLYTEDILTPTTGSFPVYTLTIINGSSLTIGSFIVNESTITIESGGALVQNSTANDNQGSGNYVVKQAEGQQSVDNYNIWSSPITNANLLTVFPSTNPCGMYVFNGSTQEWAYDWITGLAPNYLCTGNPTPVDFTGFTYSDGSSDGIMDAGRGYFIPGNATPTEKEFTGEVNNGDVLVTVYSTNVAANATTWAGDDWNLIGNPYPSSVDPAAFMTTNGSNLTDGLYFWDESISDYAVYAATGATTPSGFTIAVGQGFYVLTDDAIVPDGTSATITFENSMRDISGGSFYKTDNNENHNIGYSISTPSGEINKIVVGYSANSTDGLDKLIDAHKLSGNANIRFASLLNTEEFIIQGIASPKYGETKNIPLIVFITETGDHTFSEFKRENIPTGMNVYLKDNSAKLMSDLTKGSYTVFLDGNQEFKERFELVFENIAVKDDNTQTDKGTSSSDNTNGTNEVTSIEDVNNSAWNLSTSEIGITLSNSNGIYGSVQVLDITGRVIWTKNSNSNTSVNIDLNSVSSGIYFIQVVNGSERVYSNKFVNP